MFLKKLSALGFKSYEQLEVAFHPRINCFVGNNGVGKTNLLDAIYYLSMCKSAFNPIDSQNIRHAEDFFVVQGSYDREGKEENIYCAVKRLEGKLFKRNSKEYQRLADHVGLIPTVIISPNDSTLITEGSEERRKFLNSVIAQFDKLYLDEVIRHNRILAQRNRLLKDLFDKPFFNSDLLESIDVQLERLGTLIYTKRKDFIDRLIPIFQEYYAKVSGGNEEVSLKYISQLEHNSYSTLLYDSLAKDRSLQYTSTGTHRDDLELLVENYPIRKEGSQGQQKTFLIALKLAQFDFLKKLSGIKPILLLDDIFDKLDVDRVERFVNLVSNNGFGQIFITDTNKNRLDDILIRLNTGFKLFKITQGYIEEEFASPT